MVMQKTTPRRGCGTRVPGQIYACTGVSRFGRPLEDFILDPPVPYNGGFFRTPIVKSDNEVLFWVGEEFYPYAPDFIEEVRLYGVSKKVPINTDFGKFTPGETWLYFIHPRAVCNRLEPVHQCPKGNEEHLTGKERCITTLYYQVDAREVPSVNGPVYERTIGDTVYEVPKLLPRDGSIQTPGFFMRLPFTRFEYVAMPGGKVHPRVEAQIHNGLPIVVVSE